MGVVNHLALCTTITSNIFQRCMVADLIGYFLWPVSNYIEKITKVEYSRYLIVVVKGIPVRVTDDPDKVKHQCKRYGHHVACNIKDRNIQSDGSRLVILLEDTN